MIRMHRGILREMGVELAVGCRVLDFGCGSGSSVYAYRAAGFDAHGFDIENTLELRSPGDMQWFRLAAADGPYRIPFDDSSFDFVFSAVTMEHVMNYAVVAAEIARVLRPDAVSFHHFPSRYRPIEPHTFVPWGGVLQRYVWFLVWAQLGIRNEYQHGLEPREVARRNHEWILEHTNYLTGLEILDEFSPHFGDVRFIEDIYLRHWWLKARLAAPLVNRFPQLRSLMSGLHTRALYLRK